MKNISLIHQALISVWLVGQSFGAGLIQMSDGSDAPVRLKDHRVEVVIQNGFASTQVEQVFVNTSQRDLEAVFVLPLPAKASLSELSLLFPDHELTGEVVEKKRAKQLYQEQKAQGKDTALAEQESFRHFVFNIGRVPGASETTVRFTYYQPLMIDHGVGRFVYPLAEGGTEDPGKDFWSVDDRIDGTLGFDVTLKSAFPVAKCRVTGFEDQAEIVDVSPSDQPGSEFKARLELASDARLDRDFVFYYKLDENTPARVELIPYRESPAQDGTFMLVVTPAADLAPVANEGTDWLFVLDVSGSMKGGKIKTLSDGVARTINGFNSNDRFSIITFNNQANTLTPGVVEASAENVDEWMRNVRAIQPGGGTDLFAGLQAGYRQLDPDRTTSIILVTDGVVTAGERAHQAFKRLQEQFDVRLFSIVIGNAANKPLLEQLAHDSNGFAMQLSTEDDIYGRLMQARDKVQHQAMHDVAFSFKGGKVEEVTPLDFGSLYRGEQAILFGRYHGVGPLEVQMSAKISGQARTFSCSAELPAVDTDHPELERMWALSMIEDRMKKIRLDGESRPLVDQVVELGTEFGLVTEYTSMLVMEEAEFELAGIQQSNANRVRKERDAASGRSQQLARNHRVDHRGSNPSQGAFNGRSQASGGGGGSGPVGPLVLLLTGVTGWVRRKRAISEK